MKANRTCMVCQTSYYYCTHCDQANRGLKGYEPWRVLTHDENCRKIFNILQRNSTHEIDDKTAATLLKECDLSVLETAKDVIRNQANSILERYEATKKIQRPTQVQRKKRTPSEEVNENN